MIKLIHEITRNNLFKYNKSERSLQKPLRISCQRVLIPRKISGIFYAKFCEKYMDLEEKTQGIFYSGNFNQGFLKNTFFCATPLNP
jgi:hypothetical protein